MFYRAIFRNLLVRLDAELAHHLGMLFLRFLGFTRISKILGSGSKGNSISVMGKEFCGPFGIAAGFDKNAQALRALGDLGFSHVEIGTVTKLAQPGNPRPRLFRLPKDQALINRMGFNNEGADAIAKRLQKLRARKIDLPKIGVNIGKSKLTPLDQAAADYRYSAARLAPFADYLAVNVSSPNTQGLRSLQQSELLLPILQAVQEEAIGKPVLVKISPDLEDEQVIEVAGLVRDLSLAGVIAVNTTTSRTGLETENKSLEEIGDGGLSGPVLAKRAVEVLKLLKQHLYPRQIVISVGGVTSARDVRDRLELGASLVQGYTGFIYQGPLWAKRINQEY